MTWIKKSSTVYEFWERSLSTCDYRVLISLKDQRDLNSWRGTFKCFYKGEKNIPVSEQIVRDGSSPNDIRKKILLLFTNDTTPNCVKDKLNIPIDQCHWVPLKDTNNTHWIYKTSDLEITIGRDISYEDPPQPSTFKSGIRYIGTPPRVRYYYEICCLVKRSLAHGANYIKYDSINISRSNSFTAVEALIKTIEPIYSLTEKDLDALRNLPDGLEPSFHG